MDDLDQPPRDGAGLNNPEVRDEYRKSKVAWVEDGCLPPDEASASLEHFAHEVRAGRISDEKLLRVVLNVRSALEVTRIGSMRTILCDALLAAGVEQEKIDEWDVAASRNGTVKFVDDTLESDFEEEPEEV